MSFKNLTPLAHTALLYGQSGQIMTLHTGVTVIGHSHSHGGGGAGQIFKEYIFGTECDSFTSSDNTTGTLFFPDIPYISCFKQHSINTLNNTQIETGIQAKSITGDDFELEGTYDPDAAVNGRILVYPGEEVFGKFNRIALEQTSLPAYSSRFILTKGI